MSESPSTAPKKTTDLLSAEHMRSVEDPEKAIALVTAGGNPANLTPATLCSIMHGKYYHMMKKASFPLQPAVFIEHVTAGIAAMTDNTRKMSICIYTSMLLEVKGHDISNASVHSRSLITLAKTAGIYYKNAAIEFTRR